MLLFTILKKKTKMKAFYNFLFIAAAAAMISLPSCKKDDPDTTKPIISAILEPVNNDTLFTGSEMHIVTTVSDNEELSQLKIDIHSAADGHTHGKVDGAAYWEVIRIVELSGKSVSIDEHIDIPTTAASGPYDVIITAVDESGNQSLVTEVEIYIRNSGDLIAPSIVMSSPIAGASITAGNDFQVIAELTDNIGLEKAEIKVYKGSTLVYDFDIDLAEPSYSLNHTISTTGWSAGNYTLELIVKDQVLNTADTDVEFSVN